MCFYRFVFIIALCISCRINAQTITVFASSYDKTPTHQYYVELLRFLLDKSEREDISIVTLKENVSTHKQVLTLLQKKLIDLTWTGTKKHYEQEMRAIPIPLLKGLLGHRVFIIHGKRRAEFEQGSLLALKKLVACQGSDWLDSDILSWNGFNVLRVDRVDLIFKMLAKGRCDYYPRAIFEGYNELKVAQQQYPMLEVFDDLILEYKFPLYFFVHQDNQALAQLLTDSLNRAINDGSFIDFMENHPLTSDIFPLSKWQSKRVVKLENPYLPKSAPVDNKAMWIAL
ncbi:hypothetical protein tinsulaeT_33800 [Thalassotalea insulae]|uniref:Solute-binding protein family 3/N-terminal domain-containing protein n=1 Tax=Thalassotalea insulae TaxID=2056778 RepID=A0ABQ6GVV3_9GAMM|nr:hypothetical protein [Thalassotalea insulae]GLX80040.1 hypothetical protein tinsulaeT_33800 [Thalassotalea insulae]